MKRRWMLAAAAAIVAAVLLAAGKRLRYEWDCAFHAGLEIPAPTDLRDGGYLLPAPGAPPWGRHDYLPHAVLDLVQGRIRFFEEEQSTGLYRRYSLDDPHSPACLARTALDERLPAIPLPFGTCLAVREERKAEAQFELQGYERPRPHVPPEVVLRRRGAPDAPALARFRWFHLGELSCPVDVRTHGGHPLWNLTAFVLPDRRGEVVARAPRALGAPQDELIPSREEVRDELARANLLPPPCELPPLPVKAEVYSAGARSGGAQVDARFDAEGGEADFAIVEINHEEVPVVIVADAAAPTLWHLHMARGSQLFAFVVRGTRGQGIEGLPVDTTVLMSTERHNPQSGCSTQEIEAIVAKLQGLARPMERVEPERSGDALQFRIGKAMREGQQHFSFERPVADFEVRKEP